MDLKDIKLEYIREELKAEDLNSNPTEQLKEWLKQVKDSEVTYPNAASLSTVSKDGIPTTRIILIKEIIDNDLLFFTDYRSTKSVHIENNNNVSLLFFWKELDRQIRIIGKAKKTSEAISRTYFQSRPKESQLSAWCSHQSHENTKEQLVKNLNTQKEKFKDINSLPLPPFWGGFAITPCQYEFWQGRPNRLHDRFKYENTNEKWVITRLDP